MPTKKANPAIDLDWYKDAVIYELHIKAFCDSNGDGIGDFNGLISKLDYLQQLGVTAIWVLPFYPSPLRDDGYDIADYYSVNPAYGDIRQFKKFIDEAHKRNLRVITELVINHTSDRHQWFQRARRAPKGSPERDFYVWTDNPHQFREVRIIFQDFEASNWTWDPVAQQYYWHRFFHHQPDLNYDNPAVQKEIFKILDYWCNMGVDGFRLDAVPYLFEREGTNCENLPETHDFLRKLRKHVDKHYPGKLLLAEANMWPEDAASYFGNGDECHMNYHFPVMPRMFMALQMEDKYPVTDIFDQTPAIPDNCQWAMFLRNHDELTLEMVTDEERDYMYKVYAKDPKARINLGIRHRLAPLVENNRKKIELLNYLLFSLPGTPVLYYGDEIGMGDNFYLGDRDGVRTPMQWSGDRNAGFSTSDPNRLYLPVIQHATYHYEAVNVDMQNSNTGSLLWWMRRIIHLRRRYKVFGRGDMKFVDTENAKVLAFTRTHGDESILVLVNFSKSIQPVSLALKGFEGAVPVELFGRNKFPPIAADGAAFFTLGAYDCHWYLLEKASAAPANDHEALPVLNSRSWKELLKQSNLEALEDAVLPDYLANMRWFGGKSRSLQNIRIAQSALIPVEKDSVMLLLLEVNYSEGFPDLYQLPVAFAKAEEGEQLFGSYPKAAMARIKTAEGEGYLYDAMYSTAYQQELLRLMAGSKRMELGQSELVFSNSKALSAMKEELPSKILSAEQSNTSVTFGKNFFLKIYRKVDVAINPDMELTRFLTEQANFKNTPAFAGAIEWRFNNGAIVLGMLQEMVQNNGDAWTYMQEQLENYNEKALLKDDAAMPKPSTDLLHPLRYEELPEEMKDLIPASLAEQVALLGRRTAEMHLALASGSDQPEFRPEEFSLHYQRSLFAGFQTLVRGTFQNISKNSSRLPEELRAQAKEIITMKQDVLNILKRIYRKKIDALKIRIHGDYHLGQALFTGNDFVILDFEGEPARTYSERRLKRSALRDVAGMMRSFHYAAYGSLFLDDKITAENRARLLPFAERWYRYMCGFFMKAYMEVVKGSGLVPEDQEDLRVMLETYILEKAIYEMNYELNNRPDWLIIPFNGVRTIMDQYKANK